MLWLHGSLLLVLVERSNRRSGKLKTNLMSINNEGLGLKVWLPVTLCVAHRVADVVAELLAFTCDVAFV